MAAAAAAAEAAKASAAAANVDSYIGSLIGLITKSDIRYEGFLFDLNAQETTIGLRNVKSFGTEGRKKDGPQVPPSDKIYEYIYFRGSDIKDLQVLSSPPVQTTPSVPDDPAIIQSHFSYPTSTPISLISSGASQVTTFSSNAQSAFPAPSFQGNLSLHQSVGSPGSWGSSLPPLPVNINRPAMPTYWPGFPGSSGGISQFQQQQFPPPPQGLVVSHPVQQQSDPSTMNAPLATNAHNIVEPPRSLLPPVCTGSLNFLPPVPPSSATQLNLGLFPMPVFNLSPGLMSNNTSSSPTTLTVDTSSQVVSSSATSLNVNTSVPPVYEAAGSVLGPALHYPSMSISAKSSTETPSMSLDKAPVRSSLTPGPLFKQDPMELPSSHSLQTINNDAELVQASKSEPLSSESENAEEPGQRIAKPPAKTIRGAASSFHYHDIHNLGGIRDEMHKDVLHTPQSNRGHARGRLNGMHKGVLHTPQSSRGHARGRVNGSNGAALHSHFGYRSHTNARGNGLIRPLHPRHNNRSLGRENGPNGISLGTHHLGRSHASGGSKVSHSVTKFTEDFDFEAMNEKFNKEEVWGLLGRSTKSGSEEKDKDGDGEETYANDAEEEAGEELRKADRKPVYCKDDFFDSLSCNTLDRESGKGKVNFSERRRIDSETFGEIHKNQRGRGIQGPRRAGGFQGSYRGRGYDNVGRGRGRTAWSRVS